MPGYSEQWSQTWLLSQYINKPLKVLVYDAGSQWVGYLYDKNDKIQKSQLLHIWPKWGWKMVRGPIDDSIPRNISIAATKILQPIIHHGISIEDPLAQIRIAHANYKETLRSIATQWDIRK